MSEVGRFSFDELALLTAPAGNFIQTRLEMLTALNSATVRASI